MDVADKFPGDIDELDFENFEGLDELLTTTEDGTVTSAVQSTTTSPRTLADREFDVHFEKAKRILNLPPPEGAAAEAENTTFPTNFQSLLSQLKDVAEKGDPQLR